MRSGRMDMEIAEPPAECQMLLRRESLIPEEDDEVLCQRTMELVELAIGERLAQVDVADLGADDGRQLFDRDGFVGCALGHLMADARAGLGIEHDDLASDR